MATKPFQYQKGIDTIKRAEANLTLEQCIGVAIFQIDKYTWREKDQDIEDCHKIMFYTKWLLKLYNKKFMTPIESSINN